MAATAAAVAVAAEEDTELRDLLVQTLENSGVLNRIKAELRAAVFLALEEQEKVENPDAHGDILLFPGPFFVKQAGRYQAELPSPQTGGS